MTHTTKSMVKWGLLLLLVAVVVLVYLSSQAYATPIAEAEGSRLRVNVSEYVSWAGSALLALALAAWSSAKGLLPGPVRWALQLAQIDQVLEAAVRAWVSKNADKVKGRASFTVDLRSKAVAEMAEIALNTGNKFVLKARGTLVDKIHKRLQDYIDKNYPAVTTG